MFSSHSSEDSLLLRKSLAGLGFAAALWPWVFRGKRGNFWARMTLASGGLGAFALHARPELRHDLPRSTDFVVGAVSATGLYAIFQVGDRMARRIMPAGSEDIAAVYTFRTLANRWLITALLAGIIGPSEELFWRALLQESFMRRFGRVPGTLAGAAAYGAVHLGSRNLTLTGAAAVAGTYWGAEYAWRPRLGPLLVSHILWDIWIFLIAPTPGGLDTP